MPKKINPAKATPQAPLALRAGTKARSVSAAPQGAKADADADPDPDDDKDPNDDDDSADDQAAHDAKMADAAEKHRAAADAADSAAGTDSAAALMAYEEAHDAAHEAGSVAKSSCMKMRGAEEPDPDSKPAPAAAPPPAAPGAQAIAAASPAPTVAAHLEVAALAKLGRDFMARTGAQSAADAMAVLETGLIALEDVKKLRAADKSRAAATDLQARTERLKAAVHAGMDRSTAFNIKADNSIGLPKSAWMGVSLKQLDIQLNALGYPVGAPAARSTLIVASEDGGDEAGLAARAAASGMDVETRRAAEANVRRSQRQEQAR